MASKFTCLAPFFHRGKRIALCLFFILSASFVSCAQLRVILKLDDISAKDGHCQVQPLMNYLISRNIKASYGLIADRLDGTAYSVLKPVIQARDKEGRAMVEFWNHGLTHSRQGDFFEFKGMPYELQKAHLDSAHFLVQKNLGVLMTTFGAPFNATDSVCLKVISENPAYTKIFFSKVNTSTSVSFKRINNHVPMEKETGVPDFEYFLEQIKKSKSFFNEGIVIQGHPGKWRDIEFKEFEKILAYLDSQGCVYILPVDF
jgi:peptidoglycan/xylan/chitin deacetylase (PgdA/CDA1 family)